tara:strand:+ start:924 stop:1457 length:534 start_codon:yes stop_codon:yes gene_type:complete
MKILKTKFKDLYIIKQINNSDRRGNLRETYDIRLLKKNFLFEYCTTSKKGVLRGFHFQSKFQQSKYVNVLKGKILDVVVDLRKNSKTFGKTFKIILSKENATGLYIPRGFAHAYYSYEKENVIYYKLDNFYKPSFENGIIYNDKKLSIKWPTKNVKVSKKDKNLNSFNFFRKSIKYL